MSATRDEVVDYLATVTDGELAQLVNDARNTATARNGALLRTPAAKPATITELEKIAARKGSIKNGQELFNRKHGRAVK